LVSGQGLRLPTAAGAVIVYRGLDTSFVDKRLRNGLSYRYVLYSIDRSGNRSRGVTLTAVPRLIKLISPDDGSTVPRAPLLRWLPVKGARYYNVQLYCGRTKKLTVWPAAAQFQLPQRWRMNGRVQRLAPCRYTWFVWPGIGRRSLGKYGKLLGQSTFVVGAQRDKTS
jgi:hypothetical protein